MSICIKISDEAIFIRSKGNRQSSRSIRLKIYLFTPNLSVTAFTESAKHKARVPMSHGLEDGGSVRLDVCPGGGRIAGMDSDMEDEPLMLGGEASSGCL